ncbi:response regulator transcription factor [Hyphomicrobium sp. ghe19]|uniref:response regulator transcription factor n=1 Tax=Hyphomicrobium sp. ghe19 TaxID=2682968 RepID=UPI001366B64A|nr:Transcriptional regulatory protein DegU [Hyphomicrobium sp. ghe19]
MSSYLHKPAIAVIEWRTFFRDCITRSIAAASGLEVSGFPQVKDWIDHCDLDKTSIVLLCLGDGRQEHRLKDSIGFIFSLSIPPPVILISDEEDSGYIVDTIEQGARGYFPAQMSLDLAIEAIRLVRAGGTFVPAGSLISAQHKMENSRSDLRYSSADLFTDRQIAVIESLRRGKTNKLIAYELDMSESTVKVHIHNIMKKLDVNNRTQVAFLATEMLGKHGRFLKPATR